MMNDEQHEGLGYDPSDLHSFPYQSNDPPFDATSLVIEDIERAAELEPLDMMTQFTMGDFNYRTLDMACRLFAKCTNDSAYEGIPFADIFGACLDQAMIWEGG